MTLTARFRRASLTGATLAVAAVLAAGCSSSSSSSSATTGASATATPGSGTTTAASGATASPSGSAVAAGPAACATTDLKTTIGNSGGGTAGATYTVINFTNTSNASCTLYGYPGVSLTGASAAQIGAAATRSTTSAPKLITLAPGATGNAVLRITDPMVYSTGTCDPATSAYLKIYPPNQTQPLQLPFKTAACSKSSVKLLSVGVVTAGS